MLFACLKDGRNRFTLFLIAIFFLNPNCEIHSKYNGTLYKIWQRKAESKENVAAHVKSNEVQHLSTKISKVLYIFIWRKLGKTYSDNWRIHLPLLGFEVWIHLCSFFYSLWVKRIPKCASREEPTASKSSYAEYSAYAAYSAESIKPAWACFLINAERESVQQETCN